MKNANFSDFHKKVYIQEQIGDLYNDLKPLSYCRHYFYKKYVRTDYHTFEAYNLEKLNVIEKSCYK